MARTFANVVQTLSTEVADRPGLQPAFEQAVADARKVAPVAMDRHGIASLTDFYAYLDHLLTWIPREDSTSGVMTEKICLFYLVLNQPSVFALQTPVSPSTTRGPLSWTSQWIVDYVRCLGAFMDTPGSVTQESLATFRQATRYRMDDYIEPEGGWKTFNEFFARHVKPECRPVADAASPHVLVSPTDCTFVGSWPVDERGSVSFKGIEWSIPELLQDSQYADRFTGGTFMHSYLSPTDYHRQHSPLPGKVLETKIIQGQCFMEVGHDGAGDLQTRRRDGQSEKPLEIVDGDGFQWCQTRGLLVLDTAVGLVAVLPVGMCHICSVVMTVETGQTLDKGQEISYFQFGGSDIGLVFERSSQVDLNVTPGQPLKMGEKMGAVFSKHY